jgi:hypothetical protein
MELFQSVSGTIVAGATTSSSILSSNSSQGLHDVILGYRRPNTNQKQYLNKVMAQTRSELTNKDFNIKRAAA